MPVSQYCSKYCSVFDDLRHHIYSDSCKIYYCILDYYLVIVICVWAVVHAELFENCPETICLLKYEIVYHLMSGIYHVSIIGSVAYLA